MEGAGDREWILGKILATL